ncbi:MAG: flagellar hook-length control protein FliK [Planctomycetota bacterium]|jgi:hypothetical protein
MNACLSTIDYMFVGAADPGPASLELAGTRKSGLAENNKMGLPSDAAQSSPLPPADPTTAASKKIKTLETLANVPGNPNNTPPGKFGSALRDRVNLDVSAKGEGSRKPEKQSPSAAVASQPAVVELWFQQYSVQIEHGAKGTAKKMQPRAGRELAQLLGPQRPGESPLGAGAASGSAQGKSITAAGQGLMQPGAVLAPTAEGPRTLGSQTDIGEGGDAAGILNKAAIAATVPLDQQSKALITSARTDGSGEATMTGEKPATTNTDGFPDGQRTLFTAVELGASAVGHSKSKVNAPSGKPTISYAPTSSSPDVKPLAMPNGSAGPAGSWAGIPAEESASTILAGNPAHSNPAKGKALSSSSGDAGNKTRTGSNSISGVSSFQRVKVEAHQNSSGQTGGGRSLASNESANVTLETALPQTNAGSPTAQLFSDISSPSARVANNNNTAFTGTFASVGEQIAESIHNSLGEGQQGITIRLNPPELGRVFIKFQEHKDEITGLLEVDKIETRYEIEHELPQILRALQEAGVNIKRLDVLLTEQTEQHLFRDQSLQYGSSQRNGFAEGNNPGTTHGDGWLTSEESHQGQDMLETQVLIAGDSINMLI